MKMEKLTERVYYYPHQPHTDRPMLAYIKGRQIALAVDAGNSKDHVDEFYAALDCADLKRPDLTVITHWHWDHTFGMHHIQGLSVAHVNTNESLSREMVQLSDSSYKNILRREDECLCREYAGGKPIVVVTSDIQYHSELEVELGGVAAHIFHTQSPHSQDTTLIHIPQEQVLFLGDSTCGDFYRNGYLDRDKLRALMDVIEDTDCQYCILSHAEPLTKSELLEYLYTTLHTGSNAR